MQPQYHLLITSEKGETRHFSCSRKKLLTLTIGSAVTCSLLLSLSLFSMSLLKKNSSLRQRVAALQQQVNSNGAVIATQKQRSEEEKNRLGQQVATLNQENASQSAAFAEEKETLLSTAVQELAARSALIDQVLEKIGVSLETDTGKTSDSSGGPFIALDSPAHRELLHKADLYLETISAIPLGLPAQGEIVSDFGNRRDPFNGRQAFHAGMDFRGNRTDQAYATADGIVKEARWNGTYGRYVEVDHQNGYSTCYAHLSKYSVKAGDQVQRGQLIGYIGSSGRSTGPHLHYELRYQNKPLDPSKYTQVSRLLTDDQSTGRNK